jgi:hypothetical protein
MKITFSFGRNWKNYIKNVVDEKVISEALEVSSRKIKACLFRMLKIIRNAMLLPLALSYIGRLKGAGTHLYFQAKV